MTIAFTRNEDLNITDCDYTATKRIIFFPPIGRHSRTTGLAISILCETSRSSSTVIQEPHVSSALIAFAKTVGWGESRASLHSPLRWSFVEGCSLIETWRQTINVRCSTQPH
jgi:hypothetical protein